MENISISIKNGRFLLAPGFASPGSSVIVACGPSRCLLLFRYAEWTKVRDELLDDAGSQESGDYPFLRRLLIGSAVEEEVGRRGSIRLASYLWSFAGIEDRVLWRNANRCIELWNPGQYFEERHIELFTLPDDPNPFVPRERPLPVR